MHDLPLGFGFALAQHPKAMEHFAHLSPEEQDAVVEGARQMHTRKAMQDYIAQLELENNSQNIY